MLLGLVDERPQDVVKVLHVLCTVPTADVADWRSRFPSTYVGIAVARDVAADDVAAAASAVFAVGVVVAVTADCNCGVAVIAVVAAVVVAVVVVVVVAVVVVFVAV